MDRLLETILNIDSLLSSILLNITLWIEFEGNPGWALPSLSKTMIIN